MAGGIEIEMTRPAKRITEKLLASLLLNDRVGFAQSLKDGARFHDFTEELFFQVSESGLIGLFYERACELNVSDHLQQVFLPNNLSFSHYLEQQAKSEAIRAVQFDERFFELQKFLHDELPHMIWLKSTVLVRTLYNKLNYRLGIDYDVVVRKERLPNLIKRLRQAGWQPLLDNPGHCHQIGVGPTENLANLFLVPEEDLEGCHNLTMFAPGWPHLELKVNPLDNGIQMKELERFYSEAIDVHWRNSTFKAPSPVDHLIVELVHLHKHRLFGLGWMHDIHMLVNKLNESPVQWVDFVDRVKKEGVAQGAFVALEKVSSVLGSAVPEEVMSELESGGKLTRPLVNQVSTEFVWNANGLPMLVLNAAILGDGKRKVRILQKSFVPHDQFLSDYYLAGQKLNYWSRLKCLSMHWLVLLLPAGVVRRTFGKTYWKTPRAEEFGLDG